MVSNNSSPHVIFTPSTDEELRQTSRSPPKVAQLLGGAVGFNPRWSGSKGVLLAGILHCFSPGHPKGVGKNSVDTWGGF